MTCTFTIKTKNNFFMQLKKIKSKLTNFFRCKVSKDFYFTNKKQCFYAVKSKKKMLKTELTNFFRYKVPRYR